jgi:hypothetical protein
MKKPKGISARQKAYQRKIYDQRKAQRVCVKCGINPAMDNPPRIRCKDCRARDSDWVMGNYWKRIANGVCTRCGKNPVSKYRECMTCRSKHSRTIAKAA